MPQRITRLANTVLLIASLAGTGFAAVLGAQGPPPSESENAGTESRCIGIERTAEKPRILHDDNPRPFPFLPLIRSEVEQIGAILPEQKFTICSRVDRSTWNRRSAWLQVHIENGDDNTNPSSGWINISRAEADSWIPMP